MEFLTTPQIRELLAQRKWADLKSALARLEPAEVAAVFDECPPAEEVLLYRVLPPSLAADTFALLEDDERQRLLGQFTDQETRTLLAQLSPDDRTELFEEMPGDNVRRLMEMLTPEDRREALMLLGYPEGSVGRLMSPDLARIRSDWTVQRALESLRTEATESETLNIVYVVDAEGRLLDEIWLRQLVTAKSDTTIADLMNGQYSALSAFDDEDRAVNLMQQTGYFALPVIDSQGHLLGIVTADDVLEVAVEGATDDIHKGGAVQPLETELLKSPLHELYLRRISWLVILVLMNILSGAGIAYFEHLIEAVIALVFFLPLLVGSGGNSGSQAATIVIRSMALGDVTLGDYARVLWQEVRVSIGLGLTLAVAVFGVAYMRSGFDVALVVALSMACVVVLGSLIGMSLPFILRRVGWDPAVASAPLVASLVDVLGVLTYLGIASALLGDRIA